jgi:hypothetical protein
MSCPVIVPGSPEAPTVPPQTSPLVPVAPVNPPASPTLDLELLDTPTVDVEHSVEVTAPDAPTGGNFAAPDIADPDAVTDITVRDEPTVTVITPTASPQAPLETAPALRNPADVFDAGLSYTLPDGIDLTTETVEVDYAVTPTFSPFAPPAELDTNAAVRQENYLSTLGWSESASSSNIDAKALAIPKGLIDLNLQGTPSAVALTLQEWDRIWEGQQRDVLRANRAKQYAARQKHASLGWMMPGIVQLAQQAEAESECTELLIKHFADKANKYAEIRVETVWKAQAAFAQYVQMLRQAHATDQERFMKYDEFLKAIADMAAQIELRSVEVSASKLGAFVQHYQARVAEAALAFESAKIGVQRAQTINAADQNVVSLYSAKATHIQALAQAHGAYTDSVKTYIDGQRAQIEAFDAYLKGLGLEIEGDKLKLSRHGQLIEAGKLAIQANDSNTTRFGHDVSRFKAATDLELGRITAELEAQKLLIQAGTVNAQYYGHAIQAATSVLQAEVSTFGHEVSEYGTTTQFNLGTAKEANAVGIENAKLLTQAALATAEHATQVSISDAQQETQANIAKAQYGVQYVLGKAEVEAKVRIANAENQTRATIATTENDAKVQMSNAENATRVAVSNAENATKVAVANSENATRAAIAQVENQTRVSIANAENDTKIKIADAENQTRVDIAEAQNATQVSTTKAQGATQVAITKYQTEAQIAIADAEQDTRVEISNADNKTKANIATAQNQTQASIATAGNKTQASVATAEQITRARIATAENATRANIATAQNHTQASVANAQASAEAYKGYLANYSQWITATSSVYAQLASAAYAASNISLGASAGYNNSFSKSDSESVSTNYNYSMQESQSSGRIIS